MTAVLRPITSAANPRYRLWLQLATSARAVRDHGMTLAEGVHLATAALAAGVVPSAALMRQGTRASDVLALLPQLEALHVPCVELSAALFDRLSPVERGTGLLLALPITAADAGPPTGDVLLLDGVQDPGNAGALVRVAAAAGVRTVAATVGTVALWSPKVLRGAQGAHFALDVREQIAAPSLATWPVTWIAAVAHDAPSLWRIDLPNRALGWVVGAEGSGVSPPVLALCTLRASIPVAAGVESLNVATAAAVCLFERMRRRQAG